VSGASARTLGAGLFLAEANIGMPRPKVTAKTIFVSRLLVLKSNVISVLVCDVMLVQQEVQLV